MLPSSLGVVVLALDKDDSVVLRMLTTAPLSYSASLFFTSSICFCRYNFYSTCLLVCILLMSARPGRTGPGLLDLVGTGLPSLTGLGLLCVVGTEFLNLGREELR